MRMSGGTEAGALIFTAMFGRSAGATFYRPVASERAGTETARVS
jgi:hypothetical protein